MMRLHLDPLRVLSDKETLLTSMDRKKTLRLVDGSRNGRSKGLAEWRRSSKPDSTKTFGHGKIDFFAIGGGVVRRFTLLPGWRWSQDMGPVAGTGSCEATHFQYQISGRLHVRLKDGTDFELDAGDLAVLPAGHDTWVIGDEPVILVDWYRTSNLAKSG